jgi:diguanylate cyclase (GGDEF)-like protein
MARPGIFKRSNDAHGDLARPLIAIILMIVIIVALAVGTLWWTAGETNRIDSERTGRALINAVAGEASELQSMAGDGGNWDFAADAAYHSADPSTFLQEGGYQDGSRVGVLYDGVAVLNADASTVFAVRQGEVSSEDARQWIGADVASVLRSAAASTIGAASGLVRSEHGVRLVAVSHILPVSEARRAAHLRSNLPMRYLVFTRPLQAADLNAIGEALVVRELSLRIADAPAGQVTDKPDHHNIAPLLNINSQPIATLHWQPNAPANRAIVRSLPVMAAALLIAILASIMLLRRSYTAIAHINRVASLDSLSELPNRRALRRITQRALRDHSEVALAFIDLDGFKSVNDLYGHGVGDELIIACAHYIANISTNPGSAARLGGDEFAMLAYGPQAHERLTAAIDGLLRRLREPFHIGERSISIGASIGLASRSTAGQSAGELMRQADVAVYAAKRDGKMRWAWFDASLDAERTAALDIERRLRIGMDEGEFSLVYQPMIAAHAGTVNGFEALLRWNGGDGEAIGPGIFIPIAEDSGLIDRLGEFVLRRACTDARQWGAMDISVNVSAAQLRNRNFAKMAANVLAETGFPPSRLIIEVTETYVVTDPVAARLAIDEMRAIGVRVALDDFGTGYASIGFLRQFAFDSLKIDRALVAEAISDKGARAMLNSSIAVARALNMTTVAEGIETEAQAIVMRAAGCDQLQGWHFARETDAETTAALVCEAEQTDVRRRA